MAKYVYPAIFTKEKSGLYSVKFPDIEECVTCGDNLADALYLAQDVLAFTLYDYERDKKTVPVPSDLDNIEVSNGSFVNYVLCETLDYQKKGIEISSTTEAMTNFTFKIDKKTREGYSALCEALGLSMSAATLALIRQAVRSQSISFSLKDSNGFTLAEVAELKRRIEDIEKGKVFQHDIIEE